MKAFGLQRFFWGLLIELFDAFRFFWGIRNCRELGKRQTFNWKRSIALLKKTESTVGCLPEILKEH